MGMAPSHTHVFLSDSGRFEQSDAARMSAAYRRLDGSNSIIFSQR
jgi:hypothetical protein